MGFSLLLLCVAFGSVGGNMNLEKLRSRKTGQASTWVCIFAELFGESETVREGLTNRVEIIFCVLKIKLNLREETNIAHPKNKTQEELRLFYI